MYNVIIPEAIPSLNKGEAAILRGIQETLSLCGKFNLILYSPPAWVEDDKKRYEPEITVVTGLDFMDIANGFLEEPFERGRLFQYKLSGKLLLYSCLSILSPKAANYIFKDRFLESLANADLIVAGHDGMLGYNHFWIVLAANILKKPIALFGGGNDYSGRNKKLRVRKFLQFIANHSILLTVRDYNTREYFIANDVKPNKVHLFPDPAVLLKPCSESRVKEILQIENIPDSLDVPLYGLIPVIGGIVFKYSFTYEKDKNRKLQLRVKLWLDILIHLLDTTNAHFIFLPHCIGPTVIFDDRRMIEAIYKAIPRGRERITVIRNEYSEGELKGLMKRCDFILGERTHGLIGSVSVATPCIALTVEEDIRMHYIIKKMFKRPTFNLNSPDINSLKKLLSEEWSNREEIRSDMRDEATHIHNEATKAAMMLKERIESVLYKS
ncbi:MAG: polysaccharide pyruvyl transferase family protein [Thermodesulfovibrionales bacterium]